MTVTWIVPVTVSAPSLTTYWNESVPRKPVFGVYMQLNVSQETVPCAAAGAALVIVTTSRSGSKKGGSAVFGVFSFVVRFTSGATGAWLTWTLTVTVPVAVSVPSLTVYWKESGPR